MNSLDWKALVTLPLKKVAVLPYAQVEDLPKFSVIGVIIALALAFNYGLQVIIYHQQNLSLKEQQLPPKYPTLIPWLGSALPFLLDNANFLRTASSYAGELASSRITVAGKELYLFQDRDTVRRLWKAQSLSSPIPFYVHVLKHFFGMHNRALTTYRADNSGASPTPNNNSNVLEKNRLDYLTHEGFKRAFTGPALAPTARRYMKDLARRCEDLNVSDDWTDMPDLVQFFRTVHGAALLQAVFGPSLLKINPDFMDDAWKFDDSIPWLARLVPSFVNPEPYRTRERLRNQLKRWYKYARENFSDDCIYEDGDGDPYWGSELIRYQQKKYLQADNFDDDALASADLALVWGTVGNAIPTTMLSVYHVFKDPALLKRVREGLEADFGQTTLLDIDPAELIKSTLLSSIQAEVLRLYVNVCVMVSSPHADVSLGRWWMPKGGTALVSSGMTHMDNNYWNTRDGLYPVRSFWADRFVTYSHDQSSGPVQLAVRDKRQSEPRGKDGKPSFSVQGLEASWMPYGGGNAICPGRFLAKRVTLFTIALMTREFDIEIRPHTLEMGSWKFGMGVEKPKKPIAFRIRRRK
ncbi:cytochrome P450 [Cucurbitaria berberidis CBS 394.84]|uniref:Cytochrome P450 n=1 Tax=Cucurbitaria berberidis CBS 394.84 TaxID=1168544 RepID=A0A9P4LC56_9PLEO|nr:cytochrome P450 [Cucurbitaria berberidis CBS 394.84]KAF1849695.1 cytochrome P450 [Cucurbitaria berberidis CBS 394.84]